MHKQEDSLRELFKRGQSPYFGMFTAGKRGIPLEDIESYCRLLGIPLRPKDIQNWENGHFSHELHKRRGVLNPIIPRNVMRQKEFETQKLTEYPRLPDGWVGTERRFFPCNHDNKPMCSWGWKPESEPNLMTRSDAAVLSECRWVGQNMLYQPFIVLDIDGVGHGERDEYVISFGNKFRDTTMTYEDPAKPGSFHLYFKTDRLIPVKHFPYAKLDLMGNAVNAAVYLKNKLSNGVPMATLTEDIWDQILQYTTARKEANHGTQPYW